MRALYMNLIRTHVRSRYIKFLYVGIANAVVDVVVLNVLLSFATRPTPWLLTVCNTVAVIAAIGNSYVLNRRFTFRDLASGSHRERLFFFLQAIVNVVLNDLVLVGLSTSFNVKGTTSFYIGGNLAKLFAMFVSSSMSYLLMRFFVFRRKPIHESALL